MGRTAQSLTRRVRRPLDPRRQTARGVHPLRRGARRRPIWRSSRSARAVERAPDFAEHEAMFFEVGETTGALLAAFLHQTTRGQGAGGVRHWRYATFGDFVKDGLRLSRGMGRKNALAGLFWGGGKGVIQRQAGDRYKDPEYRRVLYEEYGRFMTSLRGACVTAEDVGTTPPDMASIFRTTRFVTCIPETVGGSGNPSPATARAASCAPWRGCAPRSPGNGRSLRQTHRDAGHGETSALR